MKKWLVAVWAVLCLPGCGGGNQQSTVPTSPATVLKTQDPQAGADRIVPVVAGWNSVAFEDRAITAVSANGSGAAGIAIFNGINYSLGSLSVDEFNAGEGTRRGMWVFSTGSGSFIYSGNNDSAAAGVTLRPGYNLIAFPGIAPVTGANLTVTRDGQNVALGSVLLPQFTEIQPNNQYQTVDVSAGGSVRAGRAYWVFASATCTLNALSGPPPSPTPIPSPSPSPSPGGPAVFTLQNSGTTQGLSGITYSSLISRFVAVGANGTILTSPDATQWTSQNSGTTLRIADVAANDRLLVAVGSRGLGSNFNLGPIWTSPDGVRWTGHTFEELTPRDLDAVATDGNIFVTVGFEGRIFTSVDGERWTKRVSGTTWGLSGVAYGNGRFVAVGGENPETEFATVLTSQDGVVWTSREAIPEDSLTGVGFCNNQFVALGFQGQIFTSPDGISWTQRRGFVGGTLLSAGFGNSLYVAVGPERNLLTSPDGVSWTPNTPPVSASTTLGGVGFGAGRLVVVGERGTILTSP